MTIPNQPPSAMSGEDWLLKIVAMGKNDGRGEGVPLPANSSPLSDDARLVAEEAARYAEAALSLFGNLRWKANEYERVAGERLQLCEKLRSDLWNETQSLTAERARSAKLRELAQNVIAAWNGRLIVGTDTEVLDRLHDLARQALETEERG